LVQFLVEELMIGEQLSRSASFLANSLNDLLTSQTGSNGGDESAIDAACEDGYETADRLAFLFPCLLEERCCWREHQ
jgi:hypothetical protein